MRTDDFGECLCDEDNERFGSIKASDFPDG
jgi:hypothetical protein